MKVKDLIEKLGCSILSGDGEKEISGFYACDLLSWVISHADSGKIWVTVMNNINILAVASLTDVACIVIPENIAVDDELIKRAEAKSVTLVATELSGADFIIKAYELWK